MSKFYTYRQNNSGGSFVYDKTKGISINVIVEANSKEEADNKAEQIGLYWNGVEEGYDCGCCGDRWSNFYIETKDTPQVWDQDVSTEYKTDYIWMKNKEEVFIHYLDGRVIGHIATKPAAKRKEKKNV